MTDRNSTTQKPSTQPKKSKCRKLDTAEFIKRSKNMHGDRFLYHKTKYKNYRTPIIVTCKKHGDIETAVGRHLQSYGCPGCVFDNNPKRWDTKKFVEKAVERFGSLYDYSLVEYKNKNEPVKIICREHGVTMQKPSIHLKALVGCPHCNGNGKLNNNRFIKKAKSVHKNKYDYSRLEYKGSMRKVTVICSSHGAFKVLARRHLDGRGCPTCDTAEKEANRERARKEAAAIFLEKAKDIHGNFYNYDFVRYKNSSTKVIIDCPSHGPYLQTPNSHLGSHGCNECAIEYKIEERRKKEAQVFVQKARGKHKDKYDYSSARYRSSKDKIVIICPQHGPFIQSVAVHLSGCGCPECGSELNRGWRRSEFCSYASKKSGGQAMLYIIKCVNGDESFFKIGITARTVKKRFKDKQSMPYKYTELWAIDGEAEYIYDLEIRLHSVLKSMAYKPKLRFSGETECFSTIKPIEPLLKEITTTDQLQLIA